MECICIDRENIIWFYFITPLGQRVNFICLCVSVRVCLLVFFFLHCCEILNGIRHGSSEIKICTERNIMILQYIYIKIQMMRVFHWITQFTECVCKHVSINIEQNANFDLDLLPTVTKTTAPSSENAQRQNVFQKEKFSPTLTNLLDWIFVISTDPRFFFSRISHCVCLSFMLCIDEC